MDEAAKAEEAWLMNEYIQAELDSIGMNFGV
jgi:hypothetical protein